MRKFAALIVGVSAFVGISASAQFEDDDQAAQTLKRLSFEELLNFEVTSASRSPEPVSNAAASIQVITGEDIRRLGIVSLPEALRLVSNLHVTRVDSHQYAISARGFNTSSANKLLVLIDGRTVYTPLFSGILWDVQDTLLEDVDRIEVISGPGATLWGSNAVNGVINIVTKSADRTQGIVFSLGGGGASIRQRSELRVGGGSDGFHYRAYGKLLVQNGMVRIDGSPLNNGWEIGQGGFRADWQRGPAEQFTLQGDLYSGTIGGSSATAVSGGNLLARYSKSHSEDSDTRIQLYYDKTHRDAPGIFGENLQTFDLDFQHRQQVNDDHNLIWGFGYRFMKDHVRSSPFLAILPDDLNRSLFNVFAQDDIRLPDKMRLTLGAKLEHNDYTGIEFQPTVRLSRNLGQDHFAWASVSRAVRTPSRFDADLFLPGTPPYLIQGGPDFKSESVVAYELGYRARPSTSLGLSATAFFHEYDNIRSLEQVVPPAPLPVVYGNGNRGRSYGLETAATYQASNRLRFKLGFTKQRVRIWPKSDSTDPSGKMRESHDIGEQMLFGATWDLPNGLMFDAQFRSVSSIPHLGIPRYEELDARLAWTPKPGFVIALSGRNLLQPRHTEYGTMANRQYAERGVYASLTWRF